MAHRFIQSATYHWYNGCDGRWVRKEGIASNPLVSNVLLLTTGMFLGSALVVRMDMLMTFYCCFALYFWTILIRTMSMRVLEGMFYRFYLFGFVY